MTSQPPLRRLMNLPGVAALERAEVLKPLPGIGETRPADPAIDACCLDLFGLTPEDADAAPRPDDWDDIEYKAPARQVAAFEAAGWDVTDAKRRPLRVLPYFSGPLWLAIRGVAGELPFVPEPEVGESGETGDWAASLAAEATRFTKR